MRLPVSEHSLETNVENAIDVVIGQNESSKILTFLRDNIYENPKVSMCKELVSNSLDIHVENNVTRPIEITLPNAFNNLLVIRDFGTGLSKEFMSTKYTQVGFSTKEEEEHSLGAYGIGRLSPLAYTDVYYIDSFYKGTLTKYMLTIYDEGARKKVSLLNIGEFATDEPSGFKVSIPIKEGDYSTIENIVREHCKYLHSQSPLINGEPAKLVPKVLEGKDKDWYVTYDFQDCIVGLIGGMPNKIRSISEYAKCHSNENYAYNRLGLVINIPIGSVTQTASKDIQKTKTTEATITKIWDKVKSEIREAYQDKLNTINNLVDAIKLVAKYDNRAGLTWKGIIFGRCNPIVLEGCDLYKAAYSKKKKVCSLDREYSHHKSYLYISEYIKVYINDLVDENQTLLAAQIASKLGENTLIVSDIKKENFNDLYNFPYLSSVISKEDLAGTPKPKRQPSTTVRTKVDTSCVTAYELRYDANLQTYCSTNKVRVPKDLDKTEYYLELTDSNKQLVCNNHYYNQQTRYTSIYLFESLNKLNLDVWVDFNVYLKEKVDSLLQTTPKLLEVVDLLENHINLWDILCCFKTIDNCDLKEFYDEVYSIYYLYFFKMSSETVNLLRLETYNQTKLNEVKLDNSLLKEYYKMEAKYPLIFKYFARNNHLYNSKGYRHIETELTLTEVNNYITLINK